GSRDARHPDRTSKASARRQRASQREEAQLRKRWRKSGSCLRYLLGRFGVFLEDGNGGKSLPGHQAPDGRVGDKGQAEKNSGASVKGGHRQTERHKANDSEQGRDFAVAPEMLNTSMQQQSQDSEERNGAEQSGFGNDLQVERMPQQVAAGVEPDDIF